MIKQSKNGFRSLYLTGIFIFEIFFYIFILFFLLIHHEYIDIITLSFLKIIKSKTEKRNTSSLSIYKK